MIEVLPERTTNTAMDAEIYDIVALKALLDLSLALRRAHPACAFTAPAARS